MKELVIDRLHTTKMGVERIKRNLGLPSVSNQSFRNDAEDVIKYCKQQIAKAKAAGKIERPNNGKNWYASTDTEEYTINVYSHTIITAHKK